MAPLDEPCSDLRDDKAFALEHSEGIAAETDEQRGDGVVRTKRVQERLDDDRVVDLLVREPERRRDGERRVRELEACAACLVDGAPRRPVERLESLGEVDAADVAHASPYARKRLRPKPRTG